MRMTEPRNAMSRTVAGSWLVASASVAGSPSVSISGRMAIITASPAATSMSEAVTNGVAAQRQPMRRRVLDARPRRR